MILAQRASSRGGAEMGQPGAVHNTIFAETRLLQAFVGLFAAWLCHTTPRKPPGKVQPGDE